MLTGRQALPYGLALFLLVAFFTLHSSTPSPPPDFNDLADSPLLHDAVAADTAPLLPAPAPAPLSPPRPKTPSVPLPLPDSASLFAQVVPRLKELVAREIPSYRNSLAKETKRCPVTHRQSNQDQLKGDGKWWATVPSTELAAARSRLARGVVARFGWVVELEGDVREGEEAAVTQLSDKEWERLFGKGGKGLVFTAGNQDTTARLLTSLRILRNHHGCKLPAEVFGFPDELTAMGASRREMEGLGVTFREISSQPRPGQWKQFQIKGEAIARSSFSEVLYLDSDNVAVRDPTFLFDAPLYQENGVVLWPDITKDGAANPIWRLTGVPCNATEWQVESGQVLINKRARGGLNLAALLITEAMQRDSEFWFKMSGGDKDTFRYAFYFLSLPYSAAPHWVSLAGAIIPTFEGHRYCGHSMLQYGLSPDEWEDTKMDNDHEPPKNHAPPLFVHANLLKHSGYNNHRGSTFDSIKSAFPDLISADNARVMKDIRARVYNHRGMCTDLWDSASDANEGVEIQVAGAYDGGHVAMFDFGESWGGLLRSFEEMYYSEGGAAGAW